MDAQEHLEAACVPNGVCRPTGESASADFYDLRLDFSPPNGMVRDQGRPLDGRAAPISVAILATCLRYSRCKSTSRRCVVARKHQNGRLKAIYQAVDQNPGRRPGYIARLLGLPRSQVTRALPALEEGGFLLSEDRRGGLWPFRRKN